MRALNLITDFVPFWINRNIQVDKSTHFDKRNAHSLDHSGICTAVLCHSCPADMTYSADIQVKSRLTPFVKET